MLHVVKNELEFEFSCLLSIKVTSLPPYRSRKNESRASNRVGKQILKVCPGEPMLEAANTVS